MFTPNADPITSISFRTGHNINDCYNSLLSDGYDYIEGDIRSTCGGKFCTLGIKREGGGIPPITNIIGTLSKGREPKDFIQDGCKYKRILDNKFNGDIHKGSCPEYLFLYYTTDNCGKNPIKDLIYGNYYHKKSSSQEVVQNSERSLRKQDLDLCTFKSKNYGYIYIIRV